MRDSQPMRTIAFSAANLYDPTVEDQPELKGPENPFTSFIREELFHPIEASSVLGENGNTLQAGA